MQCFEKSNHSCNPNSQSLWNMNILAAKTPFSAVFTPLTPQVSCRGRAQGGKGLSAEGSSPAASRELLATGLFPGKPAASPDLSVFQAPKGKRFFSLAVSMDRIEQIPAQERFFFPCNPFVSPLKQKGSASILLRELLHFVPLPQGTKIKHSHSSPPKTGAGISCSLLCLHFSLSPTFFGEKKGQFCAAQQRRHSFSLMKRILSVLKPSPAL